MTTPTGWLCPSCGKAHGPHVDTCPGPLGGIPSWPASPSIPYVSPPGMPSCGCPAGTLCMNVACPHRMEVSYTTCVAGPSGPPTPADIRLATVTGQYPR